MDVRAAVAVAAACSSPLPRRLLELVEVVDKVVARLRLVTLEAGGEIDLHVGSLVRVESGRSP